MRPIRPDLTGITDGVSHVFHGTTPEVADLPGILHQDRAFSAVFEFDEEERAEIATGARFIVTISQHPIPPISVGVLQIEEAAGEERDGVPVAPDYRCRDCGALYVMNRAIKLGFECGHCGNELRLPGAAD